MIVPDTGVNRGQPGRYRLFQTLGPSGSSDCVVRVNSIFDDGRGGQIWGTSRLSLFYSIVPGLFAWVVFPDVMLKGAIQETEENLYISDAMRLISNQH